MPDTLQATGPSADILAKAIVAQAEEEAKKLRQSAEAEAKRILAEAKAERDRRHAIESREETARVRRQTATELALARFEARQSLLKAREELIEQVFAELPAALDTLRKSASYPRLLAGLVREAAAALQGDRFIVKVAPEDRPAAEQAMRADDGPKVQIEEDAGLRGGCVVYQEDRRAYYDNSFAAIVARDKQRLRPMVAQWLFGTDESWQVS
jgi:vacuolar-type H+-ATPase subunit E/Vma4